jgi:uncharacterized MnhB-related membrane protein
MKPVHRHVTQFWSEERNLTAFLILLIVEIFIIAPMQIRGPAVVIFNNVVFFLLLLTGLLNMTHNKALQSVIATFVFLAVATRWAYLVIDIPDLKVLDGLLILTSTIGFLVIVLWQVFREGPVTAHRIQGSVAAYLLLSIIFAVAYGLLENLQPGSFQTSSALEEYSGRMSRSFYYFSVVTLTTTGYGDIAPVSAYARSLAMMEALIGQLYPAILIARLVSLHVETVRARKGKQE